MQYWRFSEAFLGGFTVKIENREKSGMPKLHKPRLPAINIDFLNRIPHNLLHAFYVKF